MIDHHAVSQETKPGTQQADVTEFARMHYGADWIEKLATELSMKPDELIQIFTSRAPFDARFVTKVSALMDVCLSELEAKLKETLSYTAQLRGTTKPERLRKLPESIGRRLDQAARDGRTGPQKRREKNKQAV